MSNEVKYKAALKEIIELQPKKPGHIDDMIDGEIIYDIAGGNIDDAYHLGMEAGNWQAVKIAKEVLQND